MALFRPVVKMFPAEKERQDLTFGNFFSYGWQAGWEEPKEGPDDAPRIRLLRILEPMWERDYRLTYNYIFGVNEEESDSQ